MSNIKESVADFEERVEHTLNSGQPGTTGREPFEEPAGTIPHGAGESHHGQHTGLSSGLSGGNHSHSQHSSGLGQHQHGTGAGSTGVGSEVRNTGENCAPGCTTAGHSHHGQHEGVGARAAGAVGGAGAEDYVRSHGGEKDSSTVDDYERRSGLTGNHGTHGHSSGLGSGNVGDRTGNLEQGASAYEGRSDRGPITGGAAGTDRFDSDRNRDNQTGKPSAFDRTGDDRRATDSKAGGLLSGLTTTDDEFTGRSSSHKGGATGAYTDTEGSFQTNTTGPGGNTALTGREGNSGNNPVAHAKSAGEEVGNAPHGTSTHPGVEHTGENKSLFQKIKDTVL